MAPSQPERVCVFAGSVGPGLMGAAADAAPAGTLEELLEVATWSKLDRL